SGIAAVAASTVSMNFVSLVPPRNTSLSPPSRTPLNSDFLNDSTPSMPSSIDPLATKFTTRTGCWCPRRCTRPIRCSSTAGVHGRIQVHHNVGVLQVQPTPPGVGGQEDTTRRVFAEAIDEQLAGRARQPAVEERMPNAARLQLADQQLVHLEPLAEDDDLHLG